MVIIIGSDITVEQSLRALDDQYGLLALGYCAGIALRAEYKGGAVAWLTVDGKEAIELTTPDANTYP